jgi:hypothetical protein
MSSDKKFTTSKVEAAIRRARALRQDAQTLRKEARLKRTDMKHYVLEDHRKLTEMKRYVLEEHLSRLSRFAA